MPQFKRIYRVYIQGESVLSKILSSEQRKKYPESFHGFSPIQGDGGGEMKIMVDPNPDKIEKVISKSRYLLFREAGMHKKIKLAPFR